MGWEEQGGEEGPFLGARAVSLWLLYPLETHLVSSGSGLSGPNLHTSEAHGGVSSLAFPDVPCVCILQQRSGRRCTPSWKPLGTALPS